MSRRVDVALIGASGVVGEPLLATLEARNFPVAELYCLDEGDAVGETLRQFGKSITITSVADFDFSQVQLVFFCGEVETAVAHAERAVDAGCTVIDCSGAFNTEYEVPLLIPGINSQLLDEYQQPRIIANPSPATIALLRVLKPLHDAVMIERVNLTTFEPVSVAGKAGIDELASQTVALLNMKEARSQVFPQQIAFNVLPGFGSLADNGYTDSEMKLVWETQKILAGEDIKLNPSAVLVPVFYGHGMTVHLESRAYLSADEAYALLEQAPGVSLPEGGGPSPVTDATKGDTVCVGRIREDISHPHGLDLWITIDNLRTGAALNAVQIAELWEKCYI
jgi:aspartate-semialdehyde dehydrogenase